MKHSIQKLLTLILPLLLAACSSPAVTAEIIVETCGASSLLKSGDVLVIRLESQMTAGYLWTNEELVDNILIAIGKPVIEPKSDDLDGGSEIQIFRFLAMEAGNTHLNFYYQRPWQKGQGFVKTCSISVSVKD